MYALNMTIIDNSAEFQDETQLNLTFKSLSMLVFLIVIAFERNIPFSLGFQSLLILDAPVKQKYASNFYKPILLW